MEKDNIIKNLLFEIDKFLMTGKIERSFTESIYSVIDNYENPTLSEEFKNMALAVHNEIDLYIASYISNHQEYDTDSNQTISAEQWLIDELKLIKEENKRFW